MKRMKELRDENRRLKKMYAEERLKAEMVQKVTSAYGASIRLVCLTFGISETCYRYPPILSDENAESLAGLFV